MTNTALRLIVNRAGAEPQEIDLPTPPVGGDLHLHLHLGGGDQPPSSAYAIPPIAVPAPSRRVGWQSAAAGGLGLLVGAVVLFDLGSHSGALAVRRQWAADQQQASAAATPAGNATADLLAQLRRVPTIEPAAPGVTPAAAPPAAPLAFGLKP